MRLTKKGVIVLIVLLTTLSIIVLGLFLGVKDNQRTLTIQTDYTPITFQLGDTEYTLTKKITVLHPQPNVYNYRAIDDIKSPKKILSGKVDLLQDKETTIELRYLIYGKENILKVLCGNFGENCPITLPEITPVVLEDSKWVVVRIDSASLGKARAVLKNDQGKLSLIDGPSTDIANSGYYPISVEEELKNE